MSEGFRVTVLAGRPYYGVSTVNRHVPNRQRGDRVEIIRTFCTRFKRAALLGRIALAGLSVLAGLPPEALGPIGGVGKLVPFTLRDSSRYPPHFVKWG